MSPALEGEFPTTGPPGKSFSVGFCFFPQWLSGKNLPAMQEIQDTWVQSLGREDAVEKEMAIHSSILAWEIPPAEEPGGLQSVGLQESGMT